MKCIICGKEINDNVICEKCKPKVNEQLCYSVALCDPNNPQNEIWAEVIAGMDHPYGFKRFSLDIADYLDENRKEYVKIKCMNLMNSNVGIYSSYRTYVLSHSEVCLRNNSINEEEKNLVRALTLDCYLGNYDWDKVNDLLPQIELNRLDVEPYLIMSTYNMKIKDYDHAVEILDDAKKVFNDPFTVERIKELRNDIVARKNGEKKPWKPQKREDIEKFNEYLKSLGVDYTELSLNKKQKIKESDFKPFRRWKDSTAPKDYIALWITSEFHLKAKEVVEISAVKVIDGKTVEKFHEYVRPINKPAKSQYVKEKEYIDAPLIPDVFGRFLKFADGGVLAIAGFDEQKKLLSRLARYSMMNELKNLIFDVVEYGEDISENFDSYTRESLLEKYGVKEGKTGQNKAEATAKLIEKMRG